jgi:hypothetical protein
MQKAIKRVSRPVLLAWLKEQLEDAFEGFLEDMSNYCSQDWEIVNDDTPMEDVALLINHDSEVVRILAKNRLAGNSVTSVEVHNELFDLLQRMNEEVGERHDMDFKKGRFYTCAELYKALGENDLAKKWKMWSLFDPYD